MSEPAGPEADGPPEQSTDDTDVGWGERPDEAEDDDERIAREKPPHY